MNADNIFPGFSVSASALKAERIRMQAIAQNLANINTTRQGNKKIPYQRKEVIFEEILKKGNFEGVKVAQIANDSSPPKIIYDPDHPDADSKGYIKKPNIDLHFEMVDLMTSSRVYQANLLAMKVYKDMAQRTLNLG